MTEQDNLQFARQAIAALNAHDLDAYARQIDDAYEGESEMTGVVHGRDGARQAMATMFQAFPDLHIDVEEMITGGDHVVIRALLTGTHQGPLAGVAPTNKKIRWHGCNVVQIRNGKVVRSRVYADNVSILRQIGVLPIPQATTA